MKNKLNKLMLGTVMAASFTASSFAQNATGTATSTTATSTTATTTVATTTASTTAMLNCMINAVDKRENSIILAQDAQNVAIKNALTVRRDSLKAAWGIADRDLRNTARKAAWSVYNTSAKTANTNLKNSKKATQELFKTEAKACGLINKPEPVRKDFKSKSDWRNFKNSWSKNLEDYDDSVFSKSDDNR
jgi:hypothetical protein